MKLHLPKMLLTAVLAVVAMNAQGAIQDTAETTSATIAGTNYGSGIIVFGTPDDGSAITPETSGAYTVFTCNKSDGTKQGNGGRYKINGNSTATLDNCGDLIVASGTYTAADGTTKTFTGGQLFISNWQYNNITTINNRILIGETGYSEGSGYNTTIRLSATDNINKRVVFTGGIKAIQNASIAVEGNFTYVEGSFDGASGTTLTLGKSGQLHLSGGGNLDTLNLGSATVTLDTTKSDGTTAAASTDYTIGKLIGNGMTVNNGTTLTITKGIDGKVTNNGTLNFTGTVDVTATSGSDERITEGVNAYSTLLYSRDIATTGGTINANDVTWTINGKDATETALTDGTFSGRAESTKYYVNEGGTIAYTASSALADTAATTKITVGAATTLDIASDAVLQQSRLTANATTKLIGSGTYAIGVSGLGSNVSLADGWTGWVRVTGGNGTNLNITGYKGKVEMNGFNGWTSKWDGQNSENIKLTNNGNSAAWTNGAYTTNTTLDPVCTFSGAWSGDGNFYANVTARDDAHMTYKYTGDISGWTGVFKSNSKSATAYEYVNLVFADNAKNMNAAIQRDGGVLNVTADTDVNFSKTISATTLTVNSGKTVSLAGNAHTIGALTINGTVETSKNNTANGFVSGAVTVNAGGTLSVVGSGQDALGWGNSATSSLTLLGSEEAKATFGLNYTGTGSLTLKTDLNMSGHSQVNGNRSFNTYGGVITATGTDNVISAGVVLRSAGSIVVEEGGELLISGTVSSSTEDRAAYSLTKTGAGLLTISGNIAGSSDHKATIIGDDANTVIASDTIGYAKLQNTTLSNAAHTFTDTVELQGSSATLGQHISLKGDLTLTGGTNINMTDAGTGKGVWMDQDKTITIDSTSTLSVAGDLALTGTAQNATVTATGIVDATHNNQLGTNGAYHNTVNIANAAITVLGNTVRNYNISGGSVTVGNDKTVTVNSTLSGTTALVLGSGASVSFAQDTSVASVSGAAATVTLDHNLAVAGNVTIGSLTLSGGADITAETIIGEHNGTITLSGLTVTDNDSKMNGNLVMAGGKLIFANNTTLTMGCSVTIGADDLVTVELTEEMVDIIAGGGRVDLFTDVEGAQLVNGKIVFTGVDGATLDKANVYSLQYDETTKTIYAAPEPATATLSLLALAALCARRRRH